MNPENDVDDLNITLGVEEEFFLVDPESRALLADPDPQIFETCKANQGPHKVVHEFLRSQIEISTRVCTSVDDVRSALMETRRVMIDGAAQHGVALMASSTHPFAAWDEQLPTPNDRYEAFANTYQESVRRLLVGGLHIHAGFGDPETRIRVMTALRRYLPVLNALSASSPFSGGRETGFKCGRLNLMGALPRTSVPRELNSKADFDRLVADYQRMEFISDGSELWWDIRPSHTFPTIELRICDICPRLEDTMGIVALYASLVRWLLRQAREDRLPPEPPTEIITENVWLAQRYGVLAFLGDTMNGGRVDIADMVTRLVDDLSEDAQALDCENELRHILDIIREGAGADRQIDCYRLSLLDGVTKEEALRSVVDMTLAETTAGI
ncbi:MAG: carboxylate-amine ligase [Gammaproteobacteria bacterium]|nr:carboxylate-amine ligase [Gammaproteobacteria bacterium]